MGYKVSKKLLTSSENIPNITVTGIEGIDLDKMPQDVKKCSRWN